MEEQENEKQERKLKDYFWMVNLLSKLQVPTSVYKACLQLSLVCQGMVVLLNQFVFYFLECFYVY